VPTKKKKSTKTAKKGQKTQNQNGNKKSPKVAKLTFFKMTPFNIGSIFCLPFSKIHYIVKMVTKKW
jgi:hypothetical protein